MSMLCFLRVNVRVNARQNHARILVGRPVLGIGFLRSNHATYYA